MDDLEGNHLSNTDIVVSLYGAPRLLPGRVRNALDLDGSRHQYAAAEGERSSCLGNVDLCRHGLMLSAWIRPTGNLANLAQLLTTAHNGLKV